jgi:hypothetical protein
MPLHHSDSTSSDDEDAAPESLSLTDSRRDVERQADTLKQFQAAEKGKKRARNRERDRRLKEQAEHSRRRRKEDEGGVDSEARMTRAMAEAEAELDDHEGDDHRQGEDREEFQGIIAGPGKEGEPHEGEDDEESHSNDEANKPHLIESRPNPNHLPEHLFASAFASQSVQPTESLTKRKADEENSKRRVKKRVGNDNSSRDRVVG